VEVRKVGVVGLGAMGAGIAQLCVEAGIDTVGREVTLELGEQAHERIGHFLTRKVDKGQLEQAARDDAMSRLSLTTELADFADCDVVIEAIVEELEPKRQLFAELERICRADAVLATNTSALSVTEIAAATSTAGRVVGMHFFNPAPVLPLVEVVSGLATRSETAAVVYETAKAWGKVPVHAASTPGFIVNRCARPFYAEALRLLAERAADPATLDAVMREAGGFRMGAFELMDMIGHDVNFAVTRSVWEAYFHDPRFTPSVFQQELVAAGFLGRKSGRGIYGYDANASKPEPRTESPQVRPARIRVAGDAAMTSGLRDRLTASGFDVGKMAADEAIAPSYLVVDDAFVVPCDGRTATTIAVGGGQPGVVVFDLAYDYGQCTRLAIARADTCTDEAAAAAIGALQAAGIAVSRIDDVAGLAVMRTVAMLANEAADAVTQGIASARDVDVAMRNGVNYPRGPLAWADTIGLDHVCTVLRNLAAHYGETRYRISPLLARRCATRAPLGE